MTIKEEILERLHNLTPLAEIRENYRSMSGIYEALREYLPETGAIVDGIQMKRMEVERDLSEKQDELEALTLEREELHAGNLELKQRNKRLADEYKSLDEELSRLKVEAKELQANGFTPDIMKKVKVVERRSGPELLAQLENAEQHLLIKNEIATFELLKARLGREIKSLWKEKKEASSKLKSEKNRLDELKLRRRTFKEAVDVVSFLFSRGYTTEDVRALEYGLKMLGAEGNPRFSLSRLVEGLRKQKSLMDLHDNLVAKEIELKKLTKALAEVRSEFKVARQIIKVFDDIKRAASKSIAKTAVEAEEGIKCQKAALEANVKESILMFEKSIGELTERVKGDLGEWSNLQRQIGELQGYLLPGMALFGVLHSDEYLEKIQPALVVQLLERLHLWIKMKQLEFSVHSVQKIQKELLDIQIWQRFQPTVLIELALTGLREVLPSETKTGTND